MTRGDIAVDRFKEGYNCAQSVLRSFSGELGLDANTALKIANGFGGGMARKQEVCGAVTGAIMVLGLRYGRGEGDDKAKQEETYRKVQDLMAVFRERMGSINCRVLLSGCDLRTEEGQKLFKENNLIATCHDCVRESCGILEKLL